MHAISLSRGVRITRRHLQIALGLRTPRLVKTSTIECLCAFFNRLITTEAAVSPLPITLMLCATCFLSARSCSQYLRPSNTRGCCCG